MINETGCCLWCGAEFPPEAARSRQYCNHQCNRMHKKDQSESKICELCGDLFKTARETRFCSRQCAMIYARLHVREPEPNDTGYIMIDGRHEHRRIAEKVLGRPLKRDEVVHHIDRDPRNNAHTNLMIMTNSYHMWLHGRMRSLGYAPKPRNYRFIWCSICQRSWSTFNFSRHVRKYHEGKSWNVTSSPRIRDSSGRFTKGGDADAQS